MDLLDSDAWLEQEAAEFALRSEHWHKNEGDEGDVAMDTAEEPPVVVPVAVTPRGCTQPAVQWAVSCPVSALQQLMEWARRGQTVHVDDDVPDHDAYCAHVRRILTIMRALSTAALAWSPEQVERDLSVITPEGAMLQLFSEEVAARRYAVIERVLYRCEDGFAERCETVSDAIQRIVREQSPELSTIVAEKPFYVETVASRAEALGVPQTLLVDVNSVLFDDALVHVHAQGLTAQRPVPALDASNPITPRARVLVPYAETSAASSSAHVRQLVGALLQHRSTRDDRWTLVAVAVRTSAADPHPLERLMTELCGHACVSQLSAPNQTPCLLSVQTDADNTLQPQQLADIQRAVHDRVGVLVTCAGPTVPTVLLANKQLRLCLVVVRPQDVPYPWPSCLHDCVRAYVALGQADRHRLCPPICTDATHRPVTHEADDLVAEMLQCRHVLRLVPKRTAAFESIVAAYERYCRQRGMVTLPDLQVHHIQRAVQHVRDMHHTHRTLPCVEYVASSRVFVNVEVSDTTEQ